MAATITVTSQDFLAGGSVIARGTAVLSSNYQTVGETFDLSGVFSGSPTVMLNGPGTYAVKHDRGTAAAGTVHAYISGDNAASLFTEVSNGTNLAAITVAWLAFGTSV